MPGVEGNGRETQAGNLREGKDPYVENNGIRVRGRNRVALRNRWTLID